MARHRPPRTRRPPRRPPAIASDKGLSGVFEALPLGVVYLDHNGQVRFLNAEARRLLSVPSSQDVSGSWPYIWGRLTGRTEASVIEDLHGVLATGRPSRFRPVRLRQGSQRSLPVEWTCSPAVHPAPRGLVVTLRDLSREEELEQERDQLAAIAEESPSPIVELDAHAQVLYANPAMVSLLTKHGYGAGGFPKVVPPGLPGLVATCLETGRPLPCENVELPGACFSWTLCPVPGQHRVRGYALDMTDSYEAQRRLVDSNRRLDQALTAARESAQAKTAFLATVSHELRTPMNGVIGMTALMMETPLSPEQRSYADTIRQCGEALLQLINDLLECSKIEAGKLELERLDFNLRTTVEQVLAQFAERAQVKGLELLGLVHAAVPTGLRGDPGRLRQVLTNLVANAVKFTDRGEVTLQAYLAEEDPESALIRFEVTDTGIGIAPETQSRLFVPFVQADSSTTRKYGGTGLGLSISKQLIELMGGQMGVRSIPDKGSTFWCTARFQKQSSSPRAIVPAGELAGRRVLIVDDNESNRMILHQLVNGWGMVDDVAQDAGDALSLVAAAKASGRPYELAILDVMMPDKDGLELARELRHHPGCPGLRIVVMTSLLRRGHAEEARKAGAMAYLTKPVRHDELRDCLRTVLGVSTADPLHHTPAPRLITRYTLAEGAARPCILIAEDNIVNQKLAVRMVEKLGFQGDVVENGQKALEAVTTGRFAAVLMDCQMPLMDGFEATRRIREHEAAAHAAGAGAGHIPIIAVTANAMAGDRERCLAAGMDEYLAKPVKLDELRQALERWTADAAGGHAAQPSPDADEPADERRTFDRARMFENIGRDEELFQQLVALFLDRHETMLGSIKEALARGDAAQVERAAHTLKGTAANLCATAVAQAAGRLEAVGHLGVLRDAPPVYAELEMEVLRAVRILKRHRSGGGEGREAA